ncbi:ARM repeat-containing protein [Metschnikowia bicuspidata]|uniref:ARM repeat-containing protein n=1 Tax=Metschnikowia bicuspidata TaxID=27322 RepID=A0A4P9ZH41_9ASCO|nr:ARM repeat-containing protein [Metschnikowia bicuspidata]
MATELELVNNVDLRLALAASDQELESTMNQLLPPLLLKFASPDTAVRQAVFKVVQNVFPRITAAPALQLPVDALLRQIKAPNVAPGTDSSTVRLYSLLFLFKGIERLSPESLVMLVPEIVRGISGFPATAAARMFAVLVKLLKVWKAPKRGSVEFDVMSATLGFDKCPADERYLADKAAKFLLLVPTSAPAPLPGLSISDAAFFTKDAGVSYAVALDLSAAKLRVLEFLKAGFSDQNLVFPLLVASVDSLSVIADASETWFRKLTIDLDDRDLVATLVGLYLGTNAPAAKPTLQDKILSLLVKFSPELVSLRAMEIAELGLGSDYARLRLTALAVIKRTAQQLCSDFKQENYCSTLAAKLKANILADGWPQLNSSKTDFHRAMKQRELQYETLGDLLSNSVAFLQNNVDYIQFLFESLEQEAAELRSLLQLVLSRLAMYLPKLSKVSKEVLRPLFRSILSSAANSASKFLALKYVNMAYSFSDVDARFMCILGTNKLHSSDAVEEARKGLDPYQFSLIQASVSSFVPVPDSQETKMPSFDSYISKIAAEFALDNSLATAWRDCQLEAILFGFRIIVMQATESQTTIIAMDEHWQTRIDEAVETDETVRKLVVQEVARLAQNNFQMDGDDAPKHQLQKFISLTFSALYDNFQDGQNIAPNSILTSVLYALLKLSPNSIIAGLECHLDAVLDILKANSVFKDSSKKLATCFGIMCTQTNVPVDYLAIVQSALRAGGSNQTEIYLFTVSVVLSRLALRNRLHDLDSQVVLSYLEELDQALKVPQLYDTCLICVAELAIYGVLGPLNTSELAEFVGRFYDLILVRAKACHELSLLTVTKLALACEELYQNTNGDLLPVEKLVFETNIAKNVEFAFVGGDCLLMLAGGWKSRYLSQHLDIQGETLTLVPPETSRFPVIMSQVLQSTKMTKPSLRKASCIWLLAIVQNLDHTPAVKNMAAEIHSAFMRFLVDRDGIVQECASRGLGLAYDLGNADLKETLVKGLIKSFTDTRATPIASGSVDAETRLFDADVLRTDDGSVSTYKDVLNLASEVGDPSLVYKFMSLAKSNASWISRRGMAFGLGKILSKSSLDTLLAHDSQLIQILVPKLYRFRFDPSNLVSQSMNDIWKALFPDSSATVKTHFESMLAEVLKGMGNREWRVRQASIAALENLLQFQPFERYEQHLEAIWNMTFRCMDDIKDSVRKEAQTLAKSLAKSLIRTADVTTSNFAVSKATKIIEQVIPFFLGNKGLLSDAEEVKHFTLKTILDLSEKGGDPIKPFIPKLITTFVELMSSLEPEIVNYLVLNAEKYNLTGNDVDAKRLQSLSTSPLLEAIDKLIGNIDETLMPDLISSLKATIKSSVGLPSKACGSRVIVMLVTKLPFLAKPYSDVLLGICIDNLKDRNLAISTSFAVSSGYCCKLASVNSIVAFSTQITELYFANKDLKTRLAAAHASNSVSKFSGYDKFDAVAAACLPLAFIGKHDDDKEVLKLFEAEWIETSSGNSATKLYFQEISLMCEAHIKCNDYAVRRVVARALAEMATVDFSGRDAEQLLLILLFACQEKSWAGKELVFDSLVQFSVKKAADLQENGALMVLLVKTVKTELNRRNKAYQVHAVRSMAKFIRQFHVYEDLVTLYIDTMDQVLDDDYLEEIGYMDENRKSEKSLKSQHAVKIEEMRLDFVRNISDAIAPEVFNQDLFRFLLKTMQEFVSSGHELSWRTAYAYNEVFKSALEPLLKIHLNFSSLDLVFEFFTLLFSLSDYKLERNVTLLAKNCGLGLELFGHYNLATYIEALKAKLHELKEQGHSSVVNAEIEKALLSLKLK